MSTIDPVRQARERSLARRGSPGAAVGLVLGAVILLVAGAALGYGAAGMLAELRTGMLDSIFADSTVPETRSFVALPVGIVGGIIGTFVMTGAARSYTGRVLSYPVVGPFTLSAVGFAVGIAVGVRDWSEPFTVGVRTDPVFGDDEVWSSIDWVAYHATTWLPLAAGAVAVLSLLIGIAGRVRKAGASRVLTRLLVEGQRAHGEVTQIPTLTEGSALLATWTVHFVDRFGTDRWVTSAGAFRRDDVPRVGDHVTVLYDPSAPGDKRRIFLGGPGASTREDFQRWSV